MNKCQSHLHLSCSKTFAKFLSYLTNFSQNERAVFRLPYENDYKLQYMLCFVFFSLIWREIALHMKI